MKKTKTTTKADLISIYDSIFKTGVLKKANFIQRHTSIKHNTAVSQILTGRPSNNNDKRTTPSLTQQKQIIDGLKDVRTDLKEKIVLLEGIVADSEVKETVK